MEQIGDQAAGFAYEADAAARVLRVRAWGFWSADVAGAFGRKVTEACRDASGFTLEMDMMELKPMREEGQLAFGALLTALPTLRIAGASVRTGPLTKLQLLRIVAAHGAKDYLRFT